jgi:hypothetical protein
MCIVDWSQDPRDDIAVYLFTPDGFWLAIFLALRRTPENPLDQTRERCVGVFGPWRVGNARYRWSKVGLRDSKLLELLLLQS